MPRNCLSLAHNAVRDNVGVCRWPLAALAALGPSAKLGIAPGRDGLAPRCDTAAELAERDGCLIFFHASNIPKRLVFVRRFFKVAHYPSFHQRKLG